MKIFASVKAGARNAKIEKIGEARFKVFVKEPAREGRANEAVKKALAEHFGTASLRVKLLSGRTSRQKVFEVVS